MNNTLKRLLPYLQDFVFITPAKPYSPYEKSLDKCAYIVAIISIAISSIYIFIANVFGIKLTDYMPACILHSYTGYYCPGCGGTRSILYFFKGDLYKSIVYHPVIAYTAIPGIYLFLSHSIFYIQRFLSYHTNISKNRTTFHKVVRPISIRPAYIYIGIIILVLQCLIKNLFKFAGYSVII